MSSERGTPRKYEDLRKQGGIELLKHLLATLHNLSESDDYEKYKDFSVQPDEIRCILKII